MNATTDMSRNLKIEAAMRFSGWVGQGHVCFFWGAAAFAYIATDAGANDVFPDVSTTTRSRNDMI